MRVCANKLLQGTVRTVAISIAMVVVMVVPAPISPPSPSIVVVINGPHIYVIANDITVTWRPTLKAPSQPDVNL
jgi:hypothetical protein